MELCTDSCCVVQTYKAIVKTDQGNRPDSVYQTTFDTVEGVLPAHSLPESLALAAQGSELLHTFQQTLFW